MSDAAQANLGKYKSGFGGEKKSTCKTTPFKIVSGYSAEKLASLGLKQTSYPTPTDPHKK